MSAILLVIHIVIAAALVGVILIQRSEGGALGGLGGGNMGGVMTGRSSANLLTRATAVLAALFIVTSLGLAIWAGHVPQSRSLLDQLPASPAATPAPSSAPQGNNAGTAPVAPAAPSGPQAPVAQ